MQKQCTGLKNFVVRLTKVRCKGSKNLPEIQGRSLQGVQKHARDSVHIFAGAVKHPPDSGHKEAGYAKPCPRSSLDSCRVCNEDFGVQIVIPRWGMTYYDKDKGAACNECSTFQQSLF